MNKSFLTLLLSALLLCCANLTQVMAQCDPAITAGTVDAPAVTVACLDGSNMSELAVTPPDASVTMMPDYRFFITTTTDTVILEISTDGTFDATTLGLGNYWVWGITYSEAEITAIAAEVNPLLPLLGLPTLPVPTTLEALFGLVQDPTIAGLLGVDPSMLTVNVIENAISQLPDALSSFGINLPLCYDVSNDYFYAVEVAETCEVVGACEADAGEAEPLPSTFCPDTDNPDDYVVTEYVVDPSGAESIEYAVVDPADGSILAVTEWGYDGVYTTGGFDWTAAEPGTYTFAGLAFNQSEIDAVTGNPLVANVLGATGGESLSEVLELIIANDGLPLPDPFTVDAVVGFLQSDLVVSLIGFTPCLDVADVTFDVEVLASPCGVVAPANNECGGATSLFADPEGTVIGGPYDNTDATSVSDPDAPSCWGEPGDGVNQIPEYNNSLWFTMFGDGGLYDIYTSSQCAGFTIDPADYITSGDTQIAIYTGSCGSLTEIACNEDAGAFGAVSGDYLSGTTLQTEAGVQYYIAIDGFRFDDGAGTSELSVGQFCITIEPGVPCTANVELSADMELAYSICSTDEVVLSVDTASLDFGPNVGDDPRVGWAVGIFDPADDTGNGNPFESAGFAGGSVAGAAVTGLAGIGGTTGGTDPFGLGQPCLWFTPVTFADYDGTNFTFDDSCFDWGAAVQVCYVADGEGDCVDQCADANIDLDPNQATSIDLCPETCFMAAVDSTTLNFGPDTTAIPVIIWAVHTAPLANDDIFSVENDGIVLDFFSATGFATEICYTDTLGASAMFTATYVVSDGTSLFFPTCAIASAPITVNYLPSDSAVCVLDCEGVPGGSAVAGTACDDGNELTVNDMYGEDCTCAGTLLEEDCEGVPGGTALPGTACDDGDETTGNDVYQSDCTCAGELIDCEGVPGGSALPGTACDDGDATTVNDMYGEDCTCAGTLLEEDCEGVPGGTALPGTACDDGDETTGNDVYQSDCTCAGELIDCEGVPGGSALPGTACDDGDATTVNDMYGEDCTCAGTATPDLEVIEITETPDGTGDFFTVSFSISGGSGVYTVDGVQSGETFTSDPIACETGYSFEVSDGNSTQTVEGTTPACPAGCTASAGTMPTGEIFVCSGGDVTVESSGFTLGTGDVLTYVLHTSSTATLSGIVTSNSDGIFSVEDGALTNTEYYISAVAGPDDGTGSPDFADPCTSVAPGTLVVFLDPISISHTVVCDDDAGEFDVDVVISGGLPAYDAAASYDVSGTFTGIVASDGAFTMGPFTDGVTYSINASDEVGCGLTFVSQIVECTKCPSGISAGTYNGSSDYAYACAGSPLEPEYSFAGVDLGSGDTAVVLVYVLHTNVGSTVGELGVIASTTETPVEFEQGSALAETIYYISAVVTTVDENGDPDLSSGCAVVSSGSSTGVFLNPITFNADIACDNDAGVGVLTIGLVDGGLVGYDASVGSYTVSGQINDVIVPGGALTSGNLDDGSSWSITVSDMACSTTEIGTVNCEKVTAIEWSYFKGEAIDEGNLLKWGAAAEYENDYFSVERSKDGESFEVIGTVEGAGTVLSATSYDFLDASAPSGLSYYRVVQYDYDGSNTSSDIISLNRSEITFGIGNVRPVPAHDYVDLTFNAVTNADVQLAVHDITGKLILNKTIEAHAGVNVHTLSVDQYAAGIYMITITDGISTETSRFVVK